MEARVEQLTNHYMLCGCGRVGRQIARKLERERASFAVVVTQSSLAGSPVAPLCWQSNMTGGSWRRPLELTVRAGT